MEQLGGEADRCVWRMGVRGVGRASARERRGRSGWPAGCARRCGCDRARAPRAGDDRRRTCGGSVGRSRNRENGTGSPYFGAKKRRGGAGRGGAGRADAGRAAACGWVRRTCSFSSPMTSCHGVERPVRHGAAGETERGVRRERTWHSQYSGVAGGGGAGGKQSDPAVSGCAALSAVPLLLLLLLLPRDVLSEARAARQPGEHGPPISITAGNNRSSRNNKNPCGKRPFCPLSSFSFANHTERDRLAPFSAPQQWRRRRAARQRSGGDRPDRCRWLGERGKRENSRPGSRPTALSQLWLELACVRRALNGCGGSQPVPVLPQWGRGGTRGHASLPTHAPTRARKKGGLLGVSAHTSAPTHPPTHPPLPPPIPPPRVRRQQALAAVGRRCRVWQGGAPRT